jgi:hypothetical protein
MTRLRTIGIAAMLAFASLAGAEDKTAKPKNPVSCDQIVEAYKHSQSVDKTADMFLVDQSRVAQCLKAAGITDPRNNDR